MEQLDITTEDKIIAAAELVFMRDGYSGSRMQEIANTAGINKAMLHYYFRSKDKLFEFIFDKKAGIMFPQMEELVETSTSFQEAIFVFIEKYVSLLIENPYLPLFVISTINGPNSKEFLKKLPVFLNMKLVELYFKDFATSKVKEINPAQFVISIFSMCAFPFLAKPLILEMTKANDEEFSELMRARILELQNYIKMILKPD